MSALNRKLIRDLLHMKGQAIAIAAVIGCGIAIFIGAQSTHWSLQSARQAYYERNRFPEVFSSLKRAPNSIAGRVRDLPGVRSVVTRIVKGVTLTVPGLEEPAVGKLISYPDRGEPVISTVHLLTGRFPDPLRNGEVLVEEAFASEHGFQQGDKIDAVMNGRLQTLTITGVAMSPEYITTIQPGSLWPDDKRFGIFWMPRRQMEAAFEMEGAFNDIALTLTGNAIEEEVIRLLDRTLAPSGGLGAYGLDLHYSHRFISDELTQLRTMSIIPPTIFLGVAAFLLNVALRRILSLQREQIAALKAFGYSNREIGFHYGGLISAIIALGSILGCLLGIYMGKSMTAMYAEFYRFPITVFKIDFRILIGGVCLSFLAGLAGVVSAVRNAVRIQPAEAMRPEPPPSYEPSFIERMGWHRFLSQAPRMILRELTRRPAKAALTSLGIAFACGILIVGNFGKDAVTFLIDFQFDLQQRQDATLTFYEAVPIRAISSLKHIDGIVSVEPFRSVPVRFRHGQFSRQTSIMGVKEKRELFRLLNTDGQEVPLPDDGLILSSALAGILSAHIGDTVHVEVLEGERAKRKVKVAGVVDDFSGTASYMNIRSLNRLMSEPPVLTGAWISIRDGSSHHVFQELKETPAIAGVTLQKVAVEGFMDSFAENLLHMRMFNVVFACIIAFGVVYNSARVALSERGRELATLRVIGFTRGEVSSILLGELAFLTVIAIPVGFAIGYSLCLFISTALETELYRIPMVLNPPTFAFAAVVVGLAALVSGLLVRRGIDHLDMVSVLKSSE
ncbi:MAG: FtsX-like permease family protein [Verrucomicrobiales bacterium]|nr:FtsX-like permease family protein [Verrucomicrobiales bacterium]